MPRARPDRGELEELKTFSHRLRYARGRARLTLREITERTGIEAGQLSRAENSKYVGMSLDTIIRLARVLEVPVGWLLADEGPLPEAPVFREPTDRRRKSELP